MRKVAWVRKKNAQLSITRKLPNHADGYISRAREYRMLQYGDACNLQLESRKLFLQGWNCGRDASRGKPADDAAHTLRRTMLRSLFGSMRWRREAPYVIPSAKCPAQKNTEQ